MRLISICSAPSGFPIRRRREISAGRFEPQHLQRLHEAYDAARQKVWLRQPAEFFAEARLDADSTVVGTLGECKEDMALAYQCEWGYHPLLVSLANTGEVLRLVNRPGNAHSAAGAAEQIDQGIELCRRAGFQKILLRDDTKFSQCSQLDRWHAQGNVPFIFDVSGSHEQHIAADDLPDSAWKVLERPPKYQVKTTPRAKPERVKQRIVEENGYRDIRLVEE